MERDPSQPRDYGGDRGRDVGDESPGILRDQAPDILSPIDESSPVSGHVPASDHRPASIAESPEHDWDAASKVIYPLLRAPGAQGLVVADIDAEALAADSARSHSQPLVDEGPSGLRSSMR